MNQNNYLLDIIETFTKEIETYADKTHAKECTFMPSFSGEEDIDHLLDYKAFIEYESHTVILRFTVHTFLSQVNHILDAYIQFGDSLPYPLHHILGYYQVKTTDIYIIPCISNPLTMKESIQLLLGNIEKVMDFIKEIDHDEFINRYRQFVETYSHIESDDYEDEYHFAFMEDIQIFETDSAYIDFLLKNNESALKKYKKKKNLTWYEQLLVSLLEEGYECEDELPYSIQYHLKTYSKNGVVKMEGREVIVMILSVIILTLAWGVFYYLFHLGLSQFLLKGGMFYLKEDPFFIFLPSFISGIGSSYFTRFSFYKLFFKKDYSNYVEKEYLQNTPKSNLFMFRFVKLILILSMIFVFVMTNSYIRFDSHGVCDNSSLFSLNGTYYSYDSVEMHYYKDQYNAFGELIGEPTYVVHTSKEDIDLYYWIDASDLEKEILPYLLDKGVDVIEKDRLQWQD